MNWVLILVLLIIILSVIRGYRKGFLHIVYSLIAWIIALLFVIWIMPYINEYLVEHTGVYEKIETGIEKSIESKVKEQTQAEVNEKGAELTSLGINLPDSVITNLLDKTAGTAGKLIENTGVYSVLAKSMAELVVKGIAFLTALFAAWILVHVISQLLGIVSRIPVIKGANRSLGLLAGAVYGFIIVWIAFCIVTLSAAGKFGAVVVAYIYEDRFLTYLYENNLILTLFLLFL